jgi:hypothetical protein
MTSRLTASRAADARMGAMPGEGGAARPNRGGPTTVRRSWGGPSRPISRTGTFSLRPSRTAVDPTPGGAR